MMPSRFTKVQIKPTRIAQPKGNSSVLTIDGNCVALKDQVTPLFNVDCQPGARAGGMVLCTVEASDGTDLQSLTTLMTYSAVNKAGTITFSAQYSSATMDAKTVTGASTITLTWPITTGVGKFTVNVSPTGSLTETVYDVSFMVLAMCGAVTLLNV
jgi:hypothetical protein